MRSLSVTIVLSLTCCLVIYAVIWKKIPQWSGTRTVKEFIWEDGKQDAPIPTTLLPKRNLTGENGNITKVAAVNVTGHVVRSTSSVSSVSETDVTLLPVLFKKNFTKLPKWDFEDVYLKSDGGRRPVCSQSVQNSKDKEFQEKALWDIQLWLHKGHLTKTEWNRLAHFNNPFGFMEYQYSYFKPVVDLIPKPKSNWLFSMPNGSADGCIRCAIVGTGGILTGSKMGKEIDSHDYVFRVNGAVIKGFEEDVGNKTSVYVHTSFSLSQNTMILKKYGFNNLPKDEGIKYVLIPEGLRDFEWLEGLLQKKRMTHGSYRGHRPLTYYSGHFSEDRFYVLHPDFLRYIRNRFLKSKTLENIYWHIYRPTNGAFALFLALHSCDVLSAYGFITEDHRKYNNYYYENDKKTRVIFYVNHDYNLEIQLWRKLHDLGIIKLYQRKENHNHTTTSKT